MLARVAHDVCDPGLAPAGIGGLMATLAGCGADILRWRRQGRCRHRRESGDFWKVAKEGDELPDIAIWKSPGRHSGVTDAVANMIKEFAVRHRLDGGGGKCRRMRIFAGTDAGFSASVIGVAEFAIPTIEIAARRDISRIGPQRVDVRLHVVGDALMQQPSRD